MCKITNALAKATVGILAVLFVFTGVLILDHGGGTAAIGEDDTQYPTYFKTNFYANGTEITIKSDKEGVEHPTIKFTGTPITAYII